MASNKQLWPQIVCAVRHSLLQDDCPSPELAAALTSAQALLDKAADNSLPHATWKYLILEKQVRYVAYTRGQSEGGRVSTAVDTHAQKSCQLQSPLALALIAALKSCTHSCLVALSCAADRPGACQPQLPARSHSQGRSAGNKGAVTVP